MPPRKQPPKPKPKRTQKQSGPGAPTICTAELTRQFAELMAAGNYLETVAGFLHVSQQDAYNWLNSNPASATNQVSACSSTRTPGMGPEIPVRRRTGRPSFASDRGRVPPVGCIRPR